MQNLIDWNKWSLDRLYNGYYNVLNQNFGNGFDIQIDDLRKKVNAHFSGNLPGIGYITFQENIFEDRTTFSCWRIVKTSNSNTPPYEYNPPLSLTGCTYPPIENCKIGRCNFPGEQVLYAGEHPMQIAHEMDFQRGDRFVIGNWELLMKDHQVFIFYTAGVQHMSHIKKIIDKHFTDVRTRLTDAHFIRYKHWMNISTSLLLSHNRMVSACISHELLRNANAVLLYPSLKYFGLSHNMAIPKQIADSPNMRLKGVFYCEVDEWQYHRRVSRVLMEGSIDHNTGNIGWSKVEGSPFLIDPDTGVIFGRNA